MIFWARVNNLDPSGELRADGENLWTDLGIGHLVPKLNDPAPKQQQSQKQT
jgi:hypothetical protein